MDKLIKMAFSAALDCSEKVYVHAFSHKDLVIGKRGLIGQEEKKGIVLSFSGLSCSEMSLEEQGIFAKLRFNGVWEDVFIPYKAISSIFDNLHAPLFLFNFHNEDETIEQTFEGEETLSDNSHKKKAEIVKPDFSKNKKP